MRKPFEQSEWIEGGKDSAQPLLHPLVDTLRCQFPGDPGGSGPLGDRR